MSLKYEPASEPLHISVKRRGSVLLVEGHVHEHPWLLVAVRQPCPGGERRLVITEHEMNMPREVALLGSIRNNVLFSPMSRGSPALPRGLHGSGFMGVYRGTSLIRKHPPPRTTIQGYLAHKKTSTPKDHHRALGIVLL